MTENGSNTPMSVNDAVAILNQLLPEPQAGLLAGILFGTKATLSKELYDSLVRSGTLHIVALSGMNITILTGLVNTSLLWLVSRRVASLLTIVLIIGFVWFVGPGASIVRAAIMGSISLLAIIFGRQYWALLTWAFAVLVMLLFNIQWISDIGFQLSVLATLGIILFGRKQETNVLKNDLRITLAAQVFTIPVILWYFHRISLVSPLSNVLIGFIIAPITALGLATVVAGWLWLPVGQILAWFAWVLLSYILIIVDLTAKIPGASLGW